MNMSEFHFIRPFWLLVLIPFMLLVLMFIRRNQPTGLWSEVCDAALLPFILQQKMLKQSRVPLFLSSIAAFLTIISLAGPTWERLPSPVFSNESALVIALDLSLSMNAADVAPTRLVRARYKIADILKHRKDGQTALIVYAGDAFTVTPLTNDVETIDSQLSALTSDIMPTQGSNTMIALQKAVDLFKQAGLPKGQILLVTDGVETAETLAAIEHYNQYTISVLAVGTAEGAPIKAAEGDFIKDDQGNIVVPKLNAEELAAVAKAGNGLYITLSDDNQDVDRLTGFFTQAVVNQNAESSKLLLQQWAEKGPWLLLGVLPLAALCFRKGLLSLLFLILIPMPKNSYALEWQDLWLTKDQQAQQAFQKKDFAKAAEQFKNPEWQAAAQYKAGNYSKALENLKSAQTADGFYNQGNALAQSGQLAEAIKAYEQALKLKPDDADAKYNKELVEKELKKQQEQKDQQEDNKDQQKSEQDKQKQQDTNKDQQDKSSDQKGDPQKQDQDKQQASQNKEPEQADNKDAQQKPEPADQKNEQSKEPKDKPEQEPAKAEQKPAEPKPDDKAPEANAAAQQEQKPKDESKQANEQWLKRIPDDPAGLLKRKFKYQYGQQDHPAPANGNAW